MQWVKWQQESSLETDTWTSLKSKTWFLIEVRLRTQIEESFATDFSFGRAQRKNYSFPDLKPTKKFN